MEARTNFAAEVAAKVITIANSVEIVAIKSALTHLFTLKSLD